MPLRLEDAAWPLALATMAGLSTSVGAIVAVVRRPSAQAMAALLGLALGVMACVSIVELVVRNAMSGESDPLLILAAAGGGALAYYVAEPFFPKMDEGHDHLVKKQDDMDDHEAFFRHLRQEEEAAAARACSGGGGGLGTGSGTAAGGGGGGAGGGSHQHQHQHVSDSDLERSAHGGAVSLGLASGGASQRKVAAAAAGGGGGAGGGAAALLGLSRKGSGAGDLGSPLVGGGGGGLPLGSAAGELSLDGSGHGSELGGGGGGGHHHVGGLLAAESQRLKAGRMMRLGLLMAMTMTIHNLPEGFAVAFSAFTDFGPVMALAIALHNIPEGVIIAAPIFAATGSRWKAVGLATASGLSEPLGALLSLLLLQPFFTQERLHYLLAFTGGVMLAVCGIELWPEGRNCRHDRAFAAGILGGVCVMGWTLYVEGTFEAAAAAAAAAGHRNGETTLERQLLGRHEAATARAAAPPMYPASELVGRDDEETREAAATAEATAEAEALGVSSNSSSGAAVGGRHVLTRATVVASGSGQGTQQAAVGRGPLPWRWVPPPSALGSCAGGGVARGGGGAARFGDGCRGRGGVAPQQQLCRRPLANRPVVERHWRAGGRAVAAAAAAAAAAAGRMLPGAGAAAAVPHTRQQLAVVRRWL